MSVFGVWAALIAGCDQGPPEGPLEPEVAVEHVRRMVKANTGSSPGSCVLGDGWGYEALRLLNRSTDPISAARIADRDPALRGFVDTPVYERWRLSRGVRFGDEAELGKLLAGHDGWYPITGGDRRLTFRASGTWEIRRWGAMGAPDEQGSWRIEGAEVVVEQLREIRAPVVQQEFALTLDLGPLGVFATFPADDC
jgi:hypothetical protein